MTSKFLIPSTLSFAIVVIGLAIAGGVRHYSPVPFWDMWNGTLEFYSRIENGDSSAWWAQHNEHRIVLARMLFWLDYRFFSGLSVFLIFVNYALVAVSATIFWLYLREARREDAGSQQDAALGFLIASWLFLWAQENNFTSGFQSQFILAQLLPLTALLCFARSCKREGYRDFVLACTLGLLSAGAMANGILALPFTFIFSVLLKQSVFRSMVLFALSLGVIFLYFLDYQAPPYHGHLSDSLTGDPIGFAHFLLLYLGSPFFFLLGQGSQGRVGATLAGITLLALSAWFAGKQFRSSSRSPTAIALLFFIFYVCSSAFATAGGRLKFGLDMAVASRYTTPAVMAFAALLLVAHEAVADAFHETKRKVAVAILIALCALVFKQQLNALAPVDDSLSTKKFAALALSLDIRDSGSIETLYPDTDTALAISRIAIQGHYSIFGGFPYLHLKQEMGKPFGPLPANRCMGYFDVVESVDGTVDFLRAYGWIFSAKEGRSPVLVRFVDNAGTVVGFALTGTPRPDVSGAIGSRAGLAGFRGYIRSGVAGSELIAAGELPDCQLQVRAPVAPSSIKHN